MGIDIPSRVIRMISRLTSEVGFLFLAAMVSTTSRNSQVIIQVG